MKSFPMKDGSAQHPTSSAFQGYPDLMTTYFD
jgi:hypothetical protein